MKDPYVANELRQMAEIRRTAQVKGRRLDPRAKAEEAWAKVQKAPSAMTKRPRGY